MSALLTPEDAQAAYDEWARDDADRPSAVARAQSARCRVVLRDLLKQYEPPPFEEQPRPAHMRGLRIWEISLIREGIRRSIEALADNGAADDEAPPDGGEGTT